ncbi:SDR family NAD(P)-dependent oxidoreductase [Pseudomonas fluorescens]|nr:SDR family NAD(P)-dependent oxidoreductase [Pseudomonas fluorescens]
MKVNFEGRVVIVTGAGSGLGKAYALEIARRGGLVVVNDLGCNVDGESASQGVADAVVDEIQAAGGKAVASHNSVATVEGGEAITATALEAFGRIDALINNAGNLRNAPFEELTDADRDAMFAVHLAGAFNVTRPAFREMRKRGYGRIVFTSSGAGLFGNREQSAYGAAKMGVVGLMNVLAQEGAPHGVLCNALAPAAMSRMAEKMNPNQIPDILAAGAAFSSAVSPEFVTALPVYLASEACSATHEIYSAVGGRYARVFIGVADGWIGPREQPATADDVAAHIDKIRDTTCYGIPSDLLDEYRLLTELITSR